MLKLSNKQLKIYNTIQTAKFKKKTRIAKIVIKYLKFEFIINNIVNKRNYLKNYILTLINKLKQATFNRDKLYIARNYYKILLKTINNKLVKIKIKQN